MPQQRRIATAPLTRKTCLYAALACGLTALGGCGSTPATTPGTTSGPAPIAAGGATAVYVIAGGNTASNSILQFNASAAGSVSPGATLTPPSGLLVSSVTSDSTGNIYVGGAIGYLPEVVVYAPGASGAATPLRTIVISAANCFPTSMTVDSAGNLYVADVDRGCIAVYAPTASGASNASRSIVGAATLLNNPNFLAADNSGNIYVSQQALATNVATILKFSAGTTGNVAPSATIAATPPTATSVPIFAGIAVDTAGNLYAALDTATASNGNLTAITSSINEYSASVSSNATPIRTIGGSLTGFIEAGGLRVDTAGNLYVLNYTVTNYSTFTGFASVFGFGATATGNQAPAVDFTSSTWTSPGTQLGIH